MPSHRGTQATYHMDEEGEESQLPALRGTSLGGKGQVGLRVCLLYDLILNPLPLVLPPLGHFGSGRMADSEQVVTTCLSSGR